MQTTDRPTRSHHLRWWKEVVLVVTFYLLYSWSRNQFGSARLETGGTPDHAFNNAIWIIRAEKALGLYHEAAIQSWFTGSTAVMQFWNTWYGIAHFVVTIAVFVVLFVKRPDVFPIWRNTILLTTGLAIIGFSMFPLMPPRLLDAPCPTVTQTAEGVEVTNYGGACIPSSERPSTPTASSERVPPGTLKCEKGPFGFVDSLECYGGPWSFENGTIKSLSNQYAAMPSLHIGWSTWCAFAMWPLLRRRWAKVAVFLYPLATLTCIIVTANHFWLDGVGGLITLGVGFALGWTLHVWNQHRLASKDASILESPPAGDPTPTTADAT